MRERSQVLGNVKRSSSKPFICVRPRVGVIKFISVFEVSKIIINKEKLEITVLLVSGDKEVVKYSDAESLESAFKRLFAEYSRVFLG